MVVVQSMAVCGPYSTQHLQTTSQTGLARVSQPGCFVRTGLRVGQRSPRARAVEQEQHSVRGQPGSDLYALREENASLRQVVRERLNTLSKEARRAVLQQHAELCALAVGVEGIPSLDSETFPEEVLETALVDGIELPRSSTLEPAHASTAAAATPVRPGHMAEQAPPAEARVPAVNGGDWEHIANGEAKVTLGDDETVVFSFRGIAVHALAATTRRQAARLAKNPSALPWPLRSRSRRAAAAWLARAEPPGAEQQGAADVGGGPETDPLQPELPEGQPEVASKEGGSGAAQGANQANAECYGAGQEHEPLAQQPSLDTSPGASAAAAAAAGKRMREGK